MTYSLSTTSQSSRAGSRASLRVASILALGLLSACSSVPQALKVLTAPVEIEKPAERPPLPNPKPIAQREVEWVVLTPDTLPEGTGWVFFAITPRDYEDASLNQAEVLRFVREATWRLRYYRGELPANATPPDQAEEK